MTPSFNNSLFSSYHLEIVTTEVQEPIIELVEQIMAAKQDNSEVDMLKKERKIDRLVYNLYGLGAEERKIVQSSIGDAE